MDSNLDTPPYGTPDDSQIMENNFASIKVENIDSEENQSPSKSTHIYKTEINDHKLRKVNQNTGKKKRKCITKSIYANSTKKGINGSAQCGICYRDIGCVHTRRRAEDKNFQCDVCGDWFKYSYTMKKHKGNHDGKYVCSVCNKRFGLPSSLKRHILIHTDDKKPYKCKYCEKSLCSTSSLAAHERLHTLEKPFKCNVCQKTFAQSSNLATHKLIHSDYKPYVCELCAKPFRHKQSLLVHLRSHTQERPYTCATCGKTFSQNTHMRTHERLHSGVKPYKCSLCQKTFSRKHHLQYHLEMHSGKTYKCSVCDKAFTAERAVIQHERIHTGETPYKCDVCGKEFKYHGYLGIHRRIHTGDLPFRCRLCSKEFIVASSLHSHLKRFHKIKERNFLAHIATRKSSSPEPNIAQNQTDTTMASKSTKKEIDSKITEIINSGGKKTKKNKLIGKAVRKIRPTKQKSKKK